MRSELRADFNLILKPELKAQGFSRVELEGCIKNEELWRTGRVWFGASFDWRDRYFEAALGHLYWFRDVMPRVVVVGDYACYADIDPTRQFHELGMVGTLESIRDSFGDALAKYDGHYAEILERRVRPGNDRYTKEYLAALGEEADEASLERFIV